MQLRHPAWDELNRLLKEKGWSYDVIELGEDPGYSLEIYNQNGEVVQRYGGLTDAAIGAVQDLKS